jgi:hypothetical protein
MRKFTYEGYMKKPAVLWAQVFWFGFILGLVILFDVVGPTYRYFSVMVKDKEEVKKNPDYVEKFGMDVDVMGPDGKMISKRIYNYDGVELQREMRDDLDKDLDGLSKDELIKIIENYNLVNVIFKRIKTSTSVTLFYPVVFSLIHIFAAFDLFSATAITLGLGTLVFLFISALGLGTRFN